MTQTGRTAPGYVFVAPTPPRGQRPTGQFGPMIVDDSGEPVWFHPTRKGVVAQNLAVQRYDGRPVLTWWEGRILQGYGPGEFVVLDETYREVVRVKAGNGYHADLHELILTDRGTAVLAIYDELVADLSAVGGPARGTLVDSLVQEVDVRDGSVPFEWKSRDHVAFEECYCTYPTTADPKLLDHFHINSIDLDTDGDLLVSARHTSAVYKLDRRTGEVVWRLGGKKSDFELGPGARFGYQHDARRQPDGTITIFDNAAWGSEKRIATESRVIALRLDTSAMRAELVSEYRHPDGLLAGAKGSAQVLPDGGVLVGWGNQPYYSEFAADGELRYDARFAAGASTYRAYRFPWVGRPATKPAVAVESGDGGRLTVYASWNGATEIARWRVDAGLRPDALSPVRTVSRQGFETAVSLERGGGRYVSVAALDRAGAPLGTSRTIQI